MVPVVDKQQKPLMPCSEKRARQMVTSNKATPFWKQGIFCVQLNVEPKTRETQPIAVGIDPGSKKEGFTVKSEKHTYLNIQADAVIWVKDAVETRRMLRRGRRYRKTPCRQNRENRSHGGLSPSTRARWGWKLRVVGWLSKLYPITSFVVEDIKAKPLKGKRRWNVSFSPLEIGKTWFYGELRKLGNLVLRSGWETKQLRDQLGLKKTKQKMSETFEAHCVDSWVLARESVGGESTPKNKRLLCVVPLRFHRRQLHRMVPSKGGVRVPYGGTRSLGWKRGSLVKHPRFGVVYLGGSSSGRVSIHSLKDGKRLDQRTSRSDCRILTYNSWRTYPVTL